MSGNQVTTELVVLQQELFRFACRLTSNRYEAQELLQETSLSVLCNERLFRPGTNFRAWCYTIMRNLFLGRRKKSMRESLYVDTSYDLQRLSSIHPEAEEQRDTEYIWRKVEELPRILSGTLTLYMCGYKYREISDQMNIPINTVKTRIFESRRRLKERLHELA